MRLIPATIICTLWAVALVDAKATTGVDPKDDGGIITWETAEDNEMLWRQEAISKLWELRAEENNFQTPLVKTVAPFDEDIHLYFKDESKSATGSLKHRFSWMLFLWAITEGHVSNGTHVFEESSGNTAKAEAYFADKLGIPFTAVVKPTVSEAKQKAIKSYNGVIMNPKNGMNGMETARALASEHENGFFMNQFANAEKALDFFRSAPEDDFGASNVMNSIMVQLDGEEHSIPTYIVHGAGSGGTGNSIGRYILHNELPTDFMVVDPEGSTVTPYVHNGAYEPQEKTSRYIEGIGSTADIDFGVNFSLNREVVNQVMRVQGQATIAAMEMVQEITGVAAGPSSGANLFGAINLAREMHDNGMKGSVVTIICDGAINYQDNYYNATWLAEHEFDNMNQWRGIVSDLWNGED